MSIPEEPPVDPAASQTESPTDEMLQQGAPDELRQVIERTSAKYITDLRALGEELARRRASPEGQLGAQTDHASGSTAPAEARFERSGGTSLDRVDSVGPASRPVPAQDHADRGGRARLWLHSASQLIESQLTAIAEHISSRLVLFVVLCCVAVLIGIGIVALLNPPLSIDRGDVAPTTQSIALNQSRQPSSLPAPTLTTLESAPIVSAPTFSPASTAVARPQAAGETASQASEALPRTAIDASAIPSAEPLSARDLLQRIAAAEAALRAGEFEATIDYGNGNRSSARVRFDLGDQQRAPRFHITSTYTGTAGAQTTERITIGDQSWQREPDGSWRARPASEAVLDQVRVLLPQVDSIATPEGDRRLQPGVLRWYDAASDVDVTVVSDPATGVPRELRQEARRTNTVLTVTYSAWNTPVEITPPEES